MGNLTTAQLIPMTDKLAAAFLGIAPTVGTNTSNTTPGLGDKTITPGSASDYGVHLKLNDLLNLVLADQDYDLSVNMLPPIKTARDGVVVQTWSIAYLSAIISALNARAQAAGLPGNPGSINDFATYYNTGAGGPFTCLFAPDFQTLYNYTNSGSPLSVVNVYSPAIANMGQWVVSGAGTGTFTAGTAVNTALYGGVAIAKLTVTSFTGTTGTATVTGTNHAGTSGRTWTVSVTGNGTFTLVPTVATDILQSVQSIAIGATVTAGTLVVGGFIPSGRSNPPT